MGNEVSQHEVPSAYPAVCGIQREALKDLLSNKLKAIQNTFRLPILLRFKKHYNTLTSFKITVYQKMTGCKQDSAPPRRALSKAT